LNIGAVCREMGMSPKKFIKALYANEQNAKFYAQTVAIEKAKQLKDSLPKIPMFTRINNKLKGIFMARRTKKQIEEDKLKETGDVTSKEADAKAESTVNDSPHSDTPVVYGGKEVTAILQDGKDTPTEYHCSMSDGTTMHVPKSLFHQE
jgi:hypothetical protein